MKPIGIAILSFHRPGDVQRAVTSVRAHTKRPYRLVILDNSENLITGEWCITHAQDAIYKRMPYNVGTCLARNAETRIFLDMGLDYWVVMDMDVEIVADGWEEDMLAVFEKHPDTGIVGWREAVASAGCGHSPDAAGLMPEIPGVCCMVSRKCVEACNGWCARYFLHRGEDSDFCLLAGTKGFTTRVVLGKDKIAHRDPHQGVAAFAGHNRFWPRSDAILRERTEALGFRKVAGVNA